jgi:hypothetical protein
MQGFKHKIGVTYTAEELQQLYGENWKSILKLDAVKRPQKPVINTFDEFDEPTKSIYKSIYEIIAEYNPNINFKVYATGSRIKGKWITEEEARLLSIEYDRYVKPSDYDYCTDAPIKPTAKIFYDRLGVKVDHVGSDHKVAIII